MTAMLRIETIGRCVAYVGERRIDPSAEMVLAGVLLFGLEAGRKLVRAEVAELLWPDAPNHVQRSRLRWLLSKLRSAHIDLGSDSTHAWIDAPHVSCDFDAFDDGIVATADAPLAGYSPNFSPSFAVWLDGQRARVVSRALRYLLPRLNAAVLAGEWRVVVDVASAVRRVDPLNEEGCLRLAEALCRVGERSRGLDTLAEYRSLVGDDRPHAQLQARLLEQRIMSTDAAGRRAEPVFVGRIEQVWSLDSLLALAREGNGGGLTLVGPPGIGKTRLLDEARLRAALAGMQVVRVRCQRTDTMRPLSGISDLVSSLVELPGALGCAPENLDRLKRLTSTEQGVTDAETMVSQIVRRGQVCDALVDLLTAVSEEGPLLVQVDDAHWLDSSLQWLWNAVISSTTTLRLAWLFAVRTGPRNSVRLELPQISIPLLDPLSAEDLLDELLGRVAAPEDVNKRAILDRGAGNPLFLRELVRHCRSAGSTECLPLTLVALLDSGISSLSRYALRVLQVASVLGTYSNLERIEAIARLPRQDLLDAVTELEAATILSTDVLGVTTSHVLWAEAAISRLTPNVRTLLHRHAALQFESELRTSTSAALLWECARHWEQSGDIERARNAVVAGADSLRSNGLHADAASAYARSLPWTVDPAERLSLIDKRIQCLHNAGKWTEALSAIDSFDSLAAEIDPAFDGHGEHEIRRWRLQYNLTTDFSAQMENTFKCASDASASVDHRLLAARECSHAAMALSTSRLIEVRRVASMIPATTITQRWDKAIIDYNYQVRCGDVMEACRLAEVLTDVAAKHPDRIKVPIAVGLRIRAFTLAGRIAQVRELSLHRIRLAKAVGSWSETCAAYDHLIGLLLDLDEVGPAERYIRELESYIDEGSRFSEFELNSFVVRAHSGQLKVMTGDFAAASKLAFEYQDITHHPTQIQARLIAVRLAAKRGIGDENEMDFLSSALRACLSEPNSWLDWPALVLGDYLADVVSTEAAADFTSDFVNRVRRELYPAPARLIALTKPVFGLSAGLAMRAS